MVFYSESRFYFHFWWKRDLRDLAPYTSPWQAWRVLPVCTDVGNSGPLRWPHWGSSAHSRLICQSYLSVSRTRAHCFTELGPLLCQHPRVVRVRCHRWKKSQCEAVKPHSSVVHTILFRLNKSLVCSMNSVMVIAQWAWYKEVMMMIRCFIHSTLELK